MRRPPTQPEGPNLTPMIDVVFLLVIFFLVGNRLQSGAQGIDVTVQSSAADRSAMARVPDQRIVWVAADGSIRLDQESMTAEQLVATLSDARDAYPGLKVAVRGTNAASFGAINDVLRLVDQAGVRGPAIGSADGPIRR